MSKKEIERKKYKVTPAFVEGPWTQFMDMHSGGGQKLDHSYIYIQAPEQEAESVFYAKFGRNPNKVTCTCCGNDYSVTESKNLYQATAYNRSCAFDREGSGGWVEKPDTQYGQSPDRYQTLAQYVESNEEACFVPATEISASDRKARLPRQGYVWVDDESDEE